MKRVFFIIAAAISLQLISCTAGEKFADLIVNSLGGDSKAGKGAYPTVISPLPSAQLEKLNAEFRDLNPKFWGNLNKYGFIDDDIKSTTYMVHPDTILTDENLMNQRAKAMLLKNSKFTGVADSTKLVVIGSWVHGKGKLWTVRFANQVYNGLEVKNSKIFTWLDAKGVYRVSGNWYSYIFIPDKQIREEDAKDIIIGFKIEYYTGWGGDKQVYIVTEQDITNPAVKIVLVQFSGENIELKVAWQISVGLPIGWHVFIDIVTGEILGTEQLWWD